ncbi:hypothetical protein TWF173_006534 [Orbilia oligospora]|nr:hypothetical protein TWF173_006534 [Orbilia oligospora]
MECGSHSQGNYIVSCTDDFRKTSQVPELNEHLLLEAIITKGSISKLAETLNPTTEFLSHRRPIEEIVSNDVVRNAFEASKTQWIDNPVITPWHDPNHRIYGVLTEANRLHQIWTSIKPRPFSPLTDPLWMEAGRTIAEVGLPWHNNQLNMPDEIDSSWQFHFKSYERRALREKGARVGDANATGYICTAREANCYCIRTLQQDLRDKHPNLRPILVYDNFDEQTILSAKSFFGLQIYRICLSDNIENICRDLNAVTNNERPVIFAATLAALNGMCDDLDIICKISESVKLLLHVDASRNFDYITTLSSRDRKLLGIRSLRLEPRLLSQELRIHDGPVRASTIVAAGSNHVDPAHAVALKPASLGAKHVKVAYVRAYDASLAGSRDALLPLWAALQEIKFGASGFQEVYQYCARMRTILIRALAGKVKFIAPSYSLDVIVQSCSQEQIESLVALGGQSLPNKGEVILTVQPSVVPNDIKSFLEALSISNKTVENIANRDFSKLYPIPPLVIDDLRETVRSWRVKTRFSAGYPLNMFSYSALGPVVGKFLDVKIPQDWLESHADQLLATRMQSFGLTGSETQFKGTLTNGSTMGNRVGIHVALARLPGAFVYFSTETHYSVSKTARDCDTITNRWLTGHKPKYSEISCDKMGSISINALVERALGDQRECRERGEEYHMVLFANMGTTFVGARDNLKKIFERLADVGVTISHIHVDGAFDFGFENCSVKLGLPGTIDEEGRPFVQGITISHHKALGGMVSGEVICYSPHDHLAPFKWNVDPRIVFEKWLYDQAFRPEDITKMYRYCQANATYLEFALRKSGFATKRNPESLIVVFERPPSWIIEEFSLRPEGDWVHFIASPHILRSTINLFIDRISWFEKQCQVAFSYVNPIVDSVLGPVELTCVRCQDPLARSISGLSESAMPLVSGAQRDIVNIAKTCMRGALSVAVLDKRGEVEVVLLIESNRNMSIKVGPLLIRARNVVHASAIVDIARQLTGFMARSMNAQLHTDVSSYSLYVI